MAAMVLRQRDSPADPLRDNRDQASETNLVKIFIVILCISVISACAGWWMYKKHHDDDFD
jgi:hypothetical protein